MTPTPASETLGPRLPFSAYPDGGRRLLGIPKRGDETVRHGYGPPVFRHLGFRCVYCNYDMGATYESWLQASVDHVVPQHAVQVGYHPTWIEDLANLVPCCRACNEFTNAYAIAEPPPTTEQEFLGVRDRAFAQKRALALASHERERNWHGTNLSAPSIPAAEPSVPELLSSYAALMDSLRSRGVVRTGNNPVSDYAESLVARAWSLERTSGSAIGYDARDPTTGRRFQVKARRFSLTYRNTGMGFIRGLDENQFDELVAVIFDPSFMVVRAAALPIEIVRRLAAYVPHVSAHQVRFNQQLLAQEGVRDVTSELRAAAADWR